jgi:hypothetical protein
MSSRPEEKCRPVSGRHFFMDWADLLDYIVANLPISGDVLEQLIWEG